MYKTIKDSIDNGDFLFYFRWAIYLYSSFHLYKLHTFTDRQIFSSRMVLHQTSNHLPIIFNNLGVPAQEHVY